MLVEVVAEVEDEMVDAELLGALADIADDVPDLRTVIVVGGASGARVPDRWQVLAWPDWSQQPDWDGPGPAPEDIACIMYTSGTSGPSKGVLMPHAHCALYGIGAIECVQLTAQDRYYVSLPLFHANGLLMQLGATLLAGIPAFVRRRFSASSWLSDIREHGLTVTNLLGATAGFILNQPATPRDRDHTLRAVLTALELPCGSAGECAASHARLAADDGAQPLPPLITADLRGPHHERLRVPAAHRARRLRRAPAHA